jgi:hypothetical protein
MLLDAQETVSLIGSDKVQGTPVYGPDGQRIGSIERAMIEKIGSVLTEFNIPHRARFKRPTRSTKPHCRNLTGNIPGDN